MRDRSIVGACLWLVLCGLTTSLLACSDAVTSDGSSVRSGGVLLDVIAPGLWPPSSDVRVELVRGLQGEGPEVVASYSKVPETLRVVPAHETPAWVGLQLVKADGQILAAGRTPPRIMSEDQPDETSPVLLHSREAALPVVDVEGQALALSSQLGSSANVVTDESLIIAGGGEAASSNPCGGGAPSQLIDKIHRVSSLDQRLSLVGKMNQARAFHSATTMPGGRLVFAGGYTSAGVSSSVEVLQVNQGQLQSSSPGLEHARARHCAVEVNGRLVLVGGDGQGATTAELWKPGVGSVAKAPLYTPRQHPACHVVTNPADGATLILVIGGVTATGSSPLNDEVLKIDGDTLSPYGTLPSSNAAAALEASAAIEAPFGVLRAGGFLASGATDWVRWIDLTGSSSSYKQAPPLSEARGCAAFGVTGLQLVVAGGLANGSQSSALDLIDLVEKKTRALGLPAARAGGWVASRQDGVVFIGGGTAGSLVSFLP